MTPVETILAFIDCINRRDPDKLSESMTEDHVFVDSLVENSLVKEWRVYADNKPVYDILARSNATPSREP
jgi:hypothetical protein